MQIITELDRQHIEKLQTLEKILKKNTSELISFAIDEIFTKNSEPFFKIIKMKSTDQISSKFLNSWQSFSPKIHCYIILKQ